MRRILAIIVLAQFAATSLWFAGNAVVGDMIRDLGLSTGMLVHITSAVQFGFITGTLVFALLALADRFSPSRVFLLSAIAAALVNLLVFLPGEGSTVVLFSRFSTGFFLAGIYPVGMKIAADHFAPQLSQSLGLLVGALVLGTALPHLLRHVSTGLPWKYVLYGTSALSLIGGIAIGLLVPDGPYKKQSQQLRLSSFLQGFRAPAFRQAAFGYFGHMWELYTFWAFLPSILFRWSYHYQQDVPVSLWSFLIIASGSLACVISGRLSGNYGARRVAFVSLLASGICCLLSFFFLQQSSLVVLLIFLFFWGMAVIADSPLFSSLVAQEAPAAVKGSSLTIVTCIGFGITVISMQLLQWLQSFFPATYSYTLLAIGPAWGIYRMSRIAAR